MANLSWSLYGKRPSIKNAKLHHAPWIKSKSCFSGEKSTNQSVNNIVSVATDHVPSKEYLNDILLYQTLIYSTTLLSI
jgi:hypothetical protein